MNKYLTRKNTLRCKTHDYRRVGWYFVTICTHGRAELFGTVKNGEMLPSTMGKVVETEWLKTAEIRDAVTLDTFVVMPNHFHGILCITDTYVGPHSVGAEGVPPVLKDPVSASFSRSSHLGHMIAGFKRATTKQINQLQDTRGAQIWQRGFYDRVIRDDHELNLVRQYISNNPMNWDRDDENPQSTTLHMK